MVYDGDGNRAAKTMGGVTTRYLVDDLNPTGYAQVVEEVVGGTAQRTYTYGLQRISQSQAISNAWVPSFYGYDGGGMVRLLTDGAGTVTDTYDYDAWGNVVNQTGNTPNVYLYRGEQYDPDLGLYYLRARYLNPLTGRFLTRDPAGSAPEDPATLHRYLYAAGNPVDRIDPTGRVAGAAGIWIGAGGVYLLIPLLLQIKTDYPFMEKWSIPTNPNQFPPPDCQEHPEGQGTTRRFPAMYRACNPNQPMADQPWYMEISPANCLLDKNKTQCNEFEETFRKTCEDAGLQRGFYSYKVCRWHSGFGFNSYCECCVGCENGKPEPWPPPKPSPTPKPKSK